MKLGILVILTNKGADKSIKIMKNNKYRIEYLPIKITWKIIHTSQNIAWLMTHDIKMKLDVYIIEYTYIIYVQIKYT